jgi:hypothetical protein
MGTAISIRMLNFFENSVVAIRSIPGQTDQMKINGWVHYTVFQGDALSMTLFFNEVDT